MTEDGIKVRGFLRAQLVDPKTGKIGGDTGWIQNKLMNTGLTVLADLIQGGANSFKAGYICAATQTDAPNMTQNAMSGSTAAYIAVGSSTSGTCTATFTVGIGSANLSASCSVGAVGIFKTNSTGSMIAMQTFTPSQWNTNQDFNVTYQLRFATA